jgi:hypothetical protein
LPELSPPPGGEKHPPDAGYIRGMFALKLNVDIFFQVFEGRYLT